MSKKKNKEDHNPAIPVDVVTPVKTPAEINPDEVFAIVPKENDFKEADKSEEDKPSEKVVFDFKDNEEVTIVGVKGSKHLKEGQEYKVGGVAAKILIKKGDARLK